MEFITEYLPDHVIQPVPRDGLCILNSFHVNLCAISREETVHSIKCALKAELQKEVYKDVFGDLSTQVEQFFSNSLRNYNSDFVDVFLEALSMAYPISSPVKL